MGPRGCTFRPGIHRAASIHWGDPLGYHFNDPLRTPSSLVIGPISQTTDIVPLSITVGTGVLILGPLIWGLLEIQSEANLAYHKLPKDWFILTFNIPDQWVEISVIGQWLHDAVAAIPREAQSILLEFKDLIPLVGRGMGALLRGLSSQLLQLILTGITFFFFLFS
jgi:hypothetical protein